MRLATRGRRMTVRPATGGGDLMRSVFSAEEDLVHAGVMREGVAGCVECCENFDGRGRRRC